MRWVLYITCMNPAATPFIDARTMSFKNGNCPGQSCLQQKPCENHFKIACFYWQCSVLHPRLHQTVALKIALRGDTENPVFTQSRPNLPTLSSPVHGTITPLATTTRNRRRFPVRRNSFKFPHLRDRASHWQREDHLGYHAYYGRTPKWSQIETYDPWIILDQIKDGAISIGEGKIRASILVSVRSYVLQKTKVWADAWGHTGKQSSSSM
ncbi:hypothetical protein EI94DRAFT_1787419 [Lactarius quietus]|nr:hypothetical protein EI94DRAFT_1787419 [Lactarius quietus]